MQPMHQRSMRHRMLPKTKMRKHRSSQADVRQPLPLPGQPQSFLSAFQAGVLSCSGGSSPFRTRTWRQVRTK